MKGTIELYARAMLNLKVKQGIYYIQLYDTERKLKKYTSENLSSYKEHTKTEKLIYSRYMVVQRY